ncbi:uncharacterized protein [Temnothorax nylanderi]|uniref:uncharacterized protein isoform X1 n=1 Tax=Temnothorax nylanderi TaxID=102681 RepID=UPI003A86A487
MISSIFYCSKSSSKRNSFTKNFLLFSKMSKDISSLSKRRKNQLLNAQIARYMTDHNQPSASRVTSDTTPLSRNCHIDRVSPLNYSIANEIHNNDQLSVSSTDFDTPITQSNVCIHTDDADDIGTNRIAEAESPIRFEVHQYSSSDSSNESFVETNYDIPNSVDMSLADQLRYWTVQNNVPHRNVNALLKILSFYGHSDLPIDVRTLMKTPRNVSYKIQPMNDGYYVHFGLTGGLKRSIAKYFQVIPYKIEININCDGLPLFKSSRAQFWPILVSIETDFYTEPIVVGIYYGDKKPADANIYLKEFIIDMTEILDNGLDNDGHKCCVIIKAIVCDAPAKSFLTYTKGHNGYFGCSKCIQEGDVVGHRITFPEIDSELRTDHSFQYQQQPEHHVGYSDLLNLNIGMVSQVVLDYMHLVCLGVIKRLIQFWVKGTKNVRLTNEQLQAASRIIQSMKCFITKEFCRKPRSLNDIDRWKATELRQFLLYTGPVVLKSVLRKDLYNHFLSLSVAIRILSDPKLCLVMNGYARSLLCWFVSHYGELYGPEYITYNVHNLVHLASDVTRFGCLDKFSAFKFENCLQAIKKQVKNSQRPLHQIVNRITEENALPIQTQYRKSYPIVHYSRSAMKIKRLEFDGFSISTEDYENCCQLNNDSIFIVTKIFSDNNVLYVRGNKYSNTRSLFLVPCDSEKFGISLINEGFISERITLLASQIQRKCLKLQNPEETTSSVVIPLLQYNY